MIVGRIIGLIFIALALVAGGMELVASLEAGEWTPLALGLVWFELSPGGINLAQALVQRYLHPSIWDPAAITVLQWPAWLPPLLLGAPLLWAFRRRGRKRLFRR